MMYDLRQVMPWRQMPRSLYFPYMHRRLEHTFTRSVVRIAYPEAWEENGKTYSGNPQHILGFIVADPASIGLILHYVYTRRDYIPQGRFGGGGEREVKACYRDQGIATKLLKGMMSDYECDHVTFTIWGQAMFSEKMFDRVMKGEWKYLFTYNPELFTTLLPHQWERGAPITLNEETARAIHRNQAAVPMGFEHIQ